MTRDATERITAVKDATVVAFDSTEAPVTHQGAIDR